MKDETKIYKLPVEWNAYDSIEVAAKSLEEAIQWVKDHRNEIPLNLNPGYCHDSFHVDDGENGYADMNETCAYLTGLYNMLHEQLERPVRPGEQPKYGPGIPLNTYKLSAYDKDSGILHTCRISTNLNEIIRFAEELKIRLLNDELRNPVNNEPFDWLEITGTKNTDIILWASYPLPYAPILRKDIPK